MWWGHDGKIPGLQKNIDRIVGDRPLTESSRNARAHIPTEATRATVAALTSYGVQQAEIARYMGFSDRTIRRHYKRELETGHLKANSEVAQFLYTSASGRALKLPGSIATHADCIRAAMFWLKTRGRWRETDNLDKPGDDMAEVLRKLAEALPR